MPTSMTGYGRGEVTLADLTATTEIRSVNHRYLDLSFRLPSGTQRFEPELRTLVQDALTRGHLDITVSVRDNRTAQTQLTIDYALARAYRDAALHVTDGRATEPELGMWVLSQAGVTTLTPQDLDEDVLHDAIVAATQTALTHLVTMREEEGVRLAEDILDRLRQLDILRAELAERAAVQPLTLLERLNARLQDLTGLDGTSLDPARVAQEAALLADKADVAEELLRLAAHLQQLREKLQAETPEGRRMDFLLQEVNREINTIASKSRDMDIDHLTIEMKALTEQIREQTQNLE